MRQRKVKNEDARLAELAQLTEQDLLQRKGNWINTFQSGEDLFLELGCGKGRFLMSLGEQHLDRNYIGIEGRGSIVLRAMEKAAISDRHNILFVQAYIKDITQYFGPGELAGIYLNFSDPWPKDRHAKRRLTHGRYLEGYRNVIRPGGSLEIKTDNEKLFAFTMEQLQQEKSGFSIIVFTEDLHSTSLPAVLATTEYENKFKAAGKPIFYCSATRDADDISSSNLRSKLMANLCNELTNL